MAPVSRATLFASEPPQMKTDEPSAQAAALVRGTKPLGGALMATHPVAHAPSLHERPSLHWTPQPPQFFGSVASSAQLPSQHVCAAAHVAAQTALFIPALPEAAPPPSAMPAVPAFDAPPSALPPAVDDSPLAPRSIPAPPPWPAVSDAS